MLEKGGVLILVFDLYRAMGSGFTCNLDITRSLLSAYLHKRGMVPVFLR